MKRAGFTMIELIFVIVILGILAAVAIPKLAATRTDAKASATMASWKTGTNQIQAVATAQGTTASVSDLTAFLDSTANFLVTATTIRATDDNNVTCALGTMDINATTSEASLVVTGVSSAAAGCVLFNTISDGTLQLLGTAVAR